MVQRGESWRSFSRPVNVYVSPYQKDNSVVAGSDMKAQHGCFETSGTNPNNRGRGVSRLREPEVCKDRALLRLRKAGDAKRRSVSAVKLVELTDDLSAGVCRANTSGRRQGGDKR